MTANALTVFETLSSKQLQIRGNIQANDESHIHLHFGLRPLYLKAQSQDLRVKARFRRKHSVVFLWPDLYGNKIYSCNVKRARPGSMSLAISSFLSPDDKKWIREQRKLPVSIMINPMDFGIQMVATVIDGDARTLAEVLVKEGWIISNKRLTNKCGYGDLLIINSRGESFIFEITRIFGSSFELKGRGRKRAGHPTDTLLGKLLKVSLYAKDVRPQPTIVFIYSYPVFPYFFDILDRLRKTLNLSIITLRCNFEQGWERKIGEQLCQTK